MLFLSRKNFIIHIFQDNLLFPSEYTTFLKRCEIKKGYTSSLMPSIDIYSIPHFDKKINFFCDFFSNVLFYEKNRRGYQVIRHQKAPSVAQMHR